MTSLASAIHWPSALLLLLALYCLVELAVNLRLSRNGRRAVRTRSRLRTLAADLQDPGSDSEQASIVRQRLRAREGERLGATEWLDALAPLRALGLLLYRAGWPISARRMLLFCGAATLAATALVLNLTGGVAEALVAGFLCFSLPLLVAWRRKRSRTRAFELQLPEALELICRALRAGHALSAGIRMVADELDDPIASEFGHVADEIALGMETREALANLCHRVDVADLAFFSTAVLIQRDTGGNLTEVMERLGHVIRERHKFYGKVSALTAQNRGAALVLLFTPPAFLLLMYKASPEFVRPLFETHSGQMLGWVAVALTLVGYAMARRLAVVKA